jgi:hypothetical protein
MPPYGSVCRYFSASLGPLFQGCRASAGLTESPEPIGHHCLDVIRVGISSAPKGNPSQLDTRSLFTIRHSPVARERPDEDSAILGATLSNGLAP